MESATDSAVESTPLGSSVGTSDAADTWREENFSSLEKNVGYEFHDGLHCRCFSATGRRSITVTLRGSDLVVMVRDYLYQSLVQQNRHGSKASNYTLKVGGVALYLDTRLGTGKTLSDYKYIQRCLLEKRAIVLRLVASNPKTSPQSKSSPQGTFAKDRPSTISSAQLQNYSTHFRRLYLNVHVNECWIRNELFDNDNRDPVYFNVVVTLYHGAECLFPRYELATPFVFGSKNLRWTEMLTFPILLVDIPQVIGLNFSVYMGRVDDEGIVRADLFGWANFHFLDESGMLAARTKSLKLWNTQPVFSPGTVMENGSNYYSGILDVELDEVFDPATLNSLRKFLVEEMKDNNPSCMKEAVCSTTELKKLETLIEKYDPITGHITAEDRHLLWKFRNVIAVNAHALPLFLQSVHWDKNFHVAEVHRLLPLWERVDPSHALQLLQPRVGDIFVRDYAVQFIDILTDEDVSLILIQLVQALQYEPFLRSGLLDLLVRRATTSWRIANQLFWLLKAQVHDPCFQTKFRASLTEVIKKWNNQFQMELMRQESLVVNLVDIALSVKGLEDNDMQQQTLKSKLGSLDFYSQLSLPLDPRFRVSGFDLEGCYCSDSGDNFCLWLAFKRADQRSKHSVDPDGVNGRPDNVILVTFKIGEDLRQDTVALQMLSIMEKIWRRSGMNMKMTTYKCTANGPNYGMIEIIQDAVTLSSVIQHAGKASRPAALSEWLLLHNSTVDRYDEAVDTFIYSCAAYCVATCILGVGDGRNRNMMIRKTGHFFHTDFRLKSDVTKAEKNIKQQCRFMFTPHFAYVMGGISDRRFKLFEYLCIEAYNRVRKEAPLLLNLLALMVSSGATTLSKPQDVIHVRENLLLEMGDDAAGNKFRSWIHRSLASGKTFFS